MREVYDDIQEDEVHFRSMQIGRYTHVYSASIYVPGDNDPSFSGISTSSLKRRAALQIEEDAEFHITHMSAAVMGPFDNADFTRDEFAHPALAMAGVTTGRSDRGIVFRMSESGSGRFLTLGQTLVQGPNQMFLINGTQQNFYWGKEGYLPLEAVFPPAYGFEFICPIPFEYHLERNRILYVDFLNRDIISDSEDSNWGHRVTFAFVGQRYDA